MITALLPVLPAVAREFSAPESSAPKTVRLVGTFQVSPDGVYKTGTFLRMHHDTARNRYFFTFGDVPSHVEPGRRGPASDRPVHQQGYAYKYYTLDLVPTGEHGVFHHGGGDAAAASSNGFLYFLTGGPGGWVLKKFDRQWRETARAEIELLPGEMANDQMVAVLGDRVVAGSLYDSAAPGRPRHARPDPRAPLATHQRIFAAEDLAFRERIVLDRPPHANGSTMIEEGDEIHFITSTAFFGDVVFIAYDTAFHYLRHRVLARSAQWSMGAAWRGDRLYVAYLAIEKGGVSNVRVGIHNRELEAIEVIEVTNFEPCTMLAGRPSLFIHGNSLFVTYDVETWDPVTRETARDWRGMVTRYEFMTVPEERG